MQHQTLTGSAFATRRARGAWFLALLAAVVALAVPGTALAHPLGNSSVAIYARVVATGDGMEVRVVVDIAEIPALRIEEFVDANENGTIEDAEATAYLDGFWAYLEPDVRLVVDDVALDLLVVEQELTFPPGEGGLKLARAVFHLVADDVPETRPGMVDAEFVLAPFGSTPGWREIIVQAGPGATIVESSVPSTDVTDELRTYPADLVETPLLVTNALFSYRIDAAAASPTASASAGAGEGSPAPSPATSPSPSSATSPSPSPAAAASPAPTPDPGGVPPSKPGDPLVGLLGQGLTLPTAIAGLLVALALGALHAVSPGHGKTLVAAYLVGTRADVRKGIWLALTVAVTHTAGVFVLGAATLAFTELVIPEQIVGWLSIASGVLVVVLGAMLVWRSRALATSMLGRTPAGDAAGHARPDHDHDDGPERGHTHPHPHTHPHAPTPDLRRRDVAMLGIVGGLVPSGSALLLLLSAVALDEVAYGLALITAFGVGMAAVLVAISTGVVLLRRTPVLGWERWRGSRLSTLAAWLPTISGVVVMVLGAWLVADALRAAR